MSDSGEEEYGGEHSYVFHGRVIPERTSVNFSGLGPFKLENGFLHFEIHASRISAIVFVDELVDNIYTLRNAVRANVRKITDSYSFWAGYGYDVEITSVVYPNGNSRTFGVGIETIKDKLGYEEANAYFEDIYKLYTEKSGEYLRRAFRDFRMAMKYPEDTGVFLYRACESIRKYFEDEFFECEVDDDDRDEAWKLMRDHIGIDRDHFYPLENHSKEPRHGGRMEISNEERSELFDDAWLVIKKFIDYRTEEIDLDVEFSIDINREQYPNR